MVLRSKPPATRCGPSAMFPSSQRAPGLPGGVALSHCQLLLLILPFLGIDKGPWMCQISTARSSAQEPATSIGWAAHVKAEYWTKTLFCSFLPVWLLRMAPNPTTSPSSLSSLRPPVDSLRGDEMRRDSLSPSHGSFFVFPPKTQLFGVRCFSAGVPVVPRHITYLYLLRSPHFSTHISGVHACLPTTYFAHLSVHS